MALYVPLSRRRRNAGLVAVATLLGGLILGFAVGRSTAVTAPERAAAVRAAGDTLGTRLEALSIEYDQAVSGTGDSIQAGVLDALVLINRDLDALVDDAPWLGDAQVEALHEATAGVEQAATGEVTPAEFATMATEAARVVRTTFGV
jgi:hypothetical protein